MLPRSILLHGSCPSVVAFSPNRPDCLSLSPHSPSPSSSSGAATSDNNIGSNSRSSACLLPLFRWSRGGGGRLSPLNASVEREREREREREKEEEEEAEEAGFEVDRLKAREALRKLDQQLQSLSQPESLPKKRPPPALPELNLDRDMMAGRAIEEMPEISGSYIAYTAVALVILTIFNNIMFNLFIKPTVDGNEQVTKIERVPLREPK